MSSAARLAVEMALTTSAPGRSTVESVSCVSLTPSAVGRSNFRSPVRKGRCRRSDPFRQSHRRPEGHGHAFGEVTTSYAGTKPVVLVGARRWRPTCQLI